MSTRSVLPFLSLGLLFALAACGTDTPVPTDGGPVDDGGIDGGTDFCADVQDCDEQGVTCAIGERVVTCTPDANGCLRESIEQCSMGTFCDAEAMGGPSCEPIPCFDVENACEAEGRRCMGTSLVECAPDADGCLVETATDCTSLGDGGACRSDGTTSQCEVPFDPCSLVEAPCDEEGDRCDGDLLIQCRPNGYGCLEEETFLCDTDACVQSATTAFCTGGPPCPNECAVTDDVVCDGPQVQRCETDEFFCPRLVRDDCTEAPNGVCNQPAFRDATCEISSVAPCEGVTECPEIGRTCDLDTLVDCRINERGCQVAERTDCLAPPRNGDICVEATSSEEITSCQPSECPPARVILGCDSEPVMGDTGIGFDDFVRYRECGDFRYRGAEAGFQIIPDRDTRVTATVTPVGTTAGEFDLFIVDTNAAGDCSDDDPCIGFSAETGNDETAEADVRAGAEAAILYDLRSNTVDPTTTQFMLTVSCTDPVCGDGLVGAFETCDDGGLVGGDGCDATCQVEEEFECFGEPSLCNRICGNSRLDQGEACDDGNELSFDGCSRSCQIERLFTCDSTLLPSTCSGSCGNAVLDASESCDDGNTVGGDGCSGCAFDLPAAGAIRTLTGTIDTEDPAWSRPNASCSPGPSGREYEVIHVANPFDVPMVAIADVVFTDGPTRNGWLHLYEPEFDATMVAENCVTGNNGSGNTASLTFEVPANGTRVLVVSSDANTPVGAYTLTLNNACGSGAYEGDLEQCDDGNGNNGDGCDDMCMIEDGYECRGEPAVCEFGRCGNLVTNPGEWCDDNDVAGDGCTNCGRDLASPRGALSYTGQSTSSGDLRFNRPNESCNADGGSASHFFDEFRVTNAGTVEVGVDIDVNWTRFNADGFVLIYDAGLWNPSNPLSGCLEANDDLARVNESFLSDVRIPAGESRVIVVTADRANDAIGTYSMTVTTLP
jgi:cysteine-rich repeat protein